MTNLFVHGLRGRGVMVEVFDAGDFFGGDGFGAGYGGRRWCFFDGAIGCGG
jgi:hypothetical protein